MTDRILELYTSETEYMQIEISRSDYDDHKEYPISEDTCKAVRGIPEWSLDWSEHLES